MTGSVAVMVAPFLVLAANESTVGPAIMKAHSWHPSPFLLHSRWVLADGSERFTERTARRGALGKFPMSEAMSHLLAHGQKLLKFGA